jgi:hypothetical protein
MKAYIGRRMLKNYPAKIILKTAGINILNKNSDKG